MYTEAQANQTVATRMSNHYCEEFQKRAGKLEIFRHFS